MDILILEESLRNRLITLNITYKRDSSLSIHIFRLEITLLYERLSNRARPRFFDAIFDGILLDPSASGATCHF